MAIEIVQTIPMLRIFSEEKAREFYLDFLGLKVDWEHRFEPDMPIYMQVSRGSLVLHLSEHHGDGCPGASVYVRIKGIREYHAELTEKRYRYYRPGIIEAPWRAWVMTVGDPFGNRIHFNEHMEEPAATDAG